MSDGPAKVKFLLDMASRFENDGNVTECAKSEETALLLRKSLGPAAVPASEGNFTMTLDKQAQGVVLKCNSRAVERFQKDEFEAAIFLLNKALFLTEDAVETNCFGPHEHDRLRLRAATYNNLGCLEKRRHNLEDALQFLHRAAEMEALVDNDIGASPSTNMNMCTVLNKLGRHTQAAAAAERAITCLKAEAQQGQEHLPQFASMMIMAHYNYGVSLEFAGRPGDISLAREAYGNVLEIAKRFLETPRSNTTVVAAEKALQRLSGTTGKTSLPLIAAPGTPGLTNPRAQPGSGTRTPAQMRPFGDSPMSSVYTPQPPTNTSMTKGPVPNRGFGTTSSMSGKQTVRLMDASQKHAARIQSRQKKKEQMKERDDRALKRAQQAHVREKEEKIRRAREDDARRRDETARVMYEKLINGLRAAEIRNMKQAAKNIQRIWRGCMVREYIRTMQRASVMIQKHVRSHLCRQRLRNEREKARQRALRAAELERHNKAAAVIQRRARIYLHRIHLVRDFRARQTRRHKSAQMIQRAYRNYRLRQEQRILDKIERERREDQERTERLHNAACKIQGMYRAFKSRRFMRVVKDQQARRAAAATKIQARMRGALTRQWFTHYRMYRRQQELSTAANMKQILRIQRAWRMAVAKKIYRRLKLEKHLRERTELLFVSSRRIQCAWRCYTARCIAGERMEALRKKQTAAFKIQGRWRVYLCRKVYLWRRDEMRKMNAIKKIQEWWKLLLLKWKHQEMARYHHAKRKEELIATVKTAAAIAIQQTMRAALSMIETEKLRVVFNRNSESALKIQKAGRFYLVQREMYTLKRVAHLVDQQHKRQVLFNKAALTIQKPVRVMLAKEKVMFLRQQRVAAVIIQKTIRMHFAKKERRRLAKIRQDALEHAAATKIQRSVRLFLKRQELKRLDAYYTERRRQKLLQMRKEEAAITIQALWRGFATRQVTSAQRSRLLQNTIDAIRIQRAWRTHVFRASIGEEIGKRIAKKRLILRSAIKIQCFWRRVLATEYVTFLREKRFLQTVACIQIQCCYRRHRAKRELEIRKVARKQQQLLQARRHDQWTVAVDIVNASLRSILAQRERLVMLEESLLGALEHRDRMEWRRRQAAATRIQANYRGHYERVYARGLRMEKAEKVRAAKELADKQEKAANCIQRGYRCAVARETVNKRRVEARLKAAEELKEAERTADPKALVKQLFWSHEAIIKKDIAKDRKERNEKLETAAVKIQKIVRMFVAMRKYRRKREEAKQNAAAAAIQEKYRQHEAKLEKKRDVQRNKAAIKIQSIARMFIAVKAWKSRQATLRTQRHAQTSLEERRDNAATTIQASWRRVLAQRRADGIREQRYREKVMQVEYEATRMIQKHVRGHIARKRVKQIRKDKGLGKPVVDQLPGTIRAPTPPSATPPYPRPQPTNNNGTAMPPRPPASGDGADGGGNARRRSSGRPYPNVASAK